MSLLDHFSCWPNQILSLYFFVAARGNPRYQIPEHLLNEMNAANTELQKKRYTGVTVLKQLLSAGFPGDSKGKKFLEQSQNRNGSMSQMLIEEYNFCIHILLVPCLPWLQAAYRISRETYLEFQMAPFSHCNSGKSGMH